MSGCAADAVDNLRDRRQQQPARSEIPLRILARPLTFALLLLSMAAIAGCRGSSGARTQKPGATDAASTPSATVPPAPTPPPPSPVGQLVYATVQKLAVEIGPRVAGTPGEIAARDYISAALRSDGYDVAAQEFGFDASDFLPARVDGGGAAIPAYILRGSGAGTVHGPLVRAGNGRPEEIPAGGLAGKIALIERGGPTFSEKAGNAIAAGAAGVIIYNNQEGSLLAPLSQSVAIPVVGIRQAAGADLAAQVDAGPLDVTITVSPPKGTAYNVIAKPAGVASCAIIVGGHYDSVPVTGGADDNASGAAAVLEVARVTAATQHQGSTCFALFSAEEFGLFGSREFVDRLPPEQLNALRAMVNLDVVGVSAGLELVGNDDLVDTARIAAGRAGITVAKGELPKGAGSDHLSFQKAGVPVVMLTRPDNVIHTPTDAIDRITADSLRETVVVALATLDALNGR